MKTNVVNMPKGPKPVNDEPPPDGEWEPSDADAPDAPPSEEQPKAPKNTAWPELHVAGIFAPLDPVNYLIGPLDICAGAPTLAAGYGFSGKTVALQSAAVSIAAGQRVWGAYTARHGRVLHIDYEQGPRLTRERYQRLAAGMLVTPDELAGRLVLTSMPQVYTDAPTSEGHFKQKCQGFDLVIVDSFRASGQTIEENDSSARGVLDMFNRVSDATGAAIVVIHHARKPNQDKAGGGARMAIRGSGAIYDACSSVLVFEGEKGQPTRVSHEKARVSGVCADDFLIRIEDLEIGGNPRGGLTVTAETSAPPTTESKAGQRLDALKERIRAHFREHGDQTSRTAIRGRLGINRDAFFAAMAELEGKGELVNTGTDKRPRLRLLDPASG
jgi:AAA domain